MRTKRPLRSRLLPAPVDRVDLELFRRTARRHSPVLDRTLPKLTRSGNGAALWLTIAAILAAVGHRLGRRAALRGIFSIAVTSFVTNVPAKLLWRRKRPAIDEVPKVRRLMRLPSSTSFPSGHSASAFAFATAVAFERPEIGIPLLGVAAAMAYSRVYVGVHYPSDVVAGAAIGAGVAAATRHLWPVAPHEPAHSARAGISLSERPGRDGSGLAIVVNAESGPALTGPSPDDVRSAFPGAEVIEADENLSIEDALARATHARAIGVCGGDGTVNAAAEVAMRHRKPLLVIPGGTLNHFARDIGMHSLDDAVNAVESGDAVEVDVGMIDDRPFLNTASFGNYVDLVDARERLEDQIGKWPAVVFALARVLRRATPVVIEIDGEPQDVWMAFIGNCRYEPDGFAPTWREQLDDDVIDVRIVSARQPWARLRLLAAVATGTLARSRVYTAKVATSPIKLRSMDGPIRLARDGETFDAHESFTIEKTPERLVVLTPPSTS